MNPGFYKLNEAGDDFFYGPYRITSPTYTLMAEHHNMYIYPHDGWYWFDSEDQARAFFGLEVPDDQVP